MHIKQQIHPVAMKKTFTLFVTLLFMLGFANAQDVYYSGNGNGIGKIWKNNTLLYSIADTANVNLFDMKVNDDGSLYSAGYNYADLRGHVWMNDSILFTTNATTSVERIILNADGWTAAGGNTVWQNGEILYEYTIDSATCNLYALDVDANIGDIYAGGSFVTPGVYACVWKNDTILWQCDGWSEIKDLCFDGGNLYAAGFVYTSDGIDGALWQNDSIIFQIEAGNIIAVTSYEGSLYWAGMVGDTAYIWQDGEMLYSHSACSNITALCVNEYGVYYATFNDESSTLWKDGEMLYQPEDCQNIVAIAVMPSDESGVYNLPWYDGFETDSTYWDEWTILDFDGNTAIGWERNDDEAATADYSARHLAFDNIQEGWLITPPLYLQPDQDSTWMTFKTMEVNPENFTTSSLLVSTTGTELADFTQIWAQDSPTEDWASVRIDLSDYQGDTIYLAFKYSGHHGHDWYIDDIAVEEILTLYNIVVEADSTGWGTVTGGGAYHPGDTIQIEAFPTVGHEFLHWNDSIVDNPRTIVVTQDSTFTAYFGTLQFLIETYASPEAYGIVTGGGTYPYGDTIQIEAIPNLGYTFLGWDDGITDNPRTIVVTENASYTANFDVQQCVITTGVTPEGAGTVTGGGTYGYGETVTLTAQNNEGYVFSQWYDGVTDSQRDILVEGDATYIAIFTPLQYEITTACLPAEGGFVDGGGIYDCGSTAVLTAVAHEGYSFLCWSDGITSNPRYVTVTQNATYTARFLANAPTQYTVTVLANDPSLGTVSGGGTYDEGSDIEISAEPFEGCFFKQWDDGNTDNPRRITVTEDMTFIAMFGTTETYTIQVRPENPLYGSVYGGGTYPVNTVITIGAVPAQGYYFSGWQDGNVDNPRTITVTENALYTASFSPNPVVTYNVTVNYDANHGYVVGGGTFVAGSIISIAAIPYEGYQFDRWSDNSTDNPKEILVDHDITLTAFFRFTNVDEHGSVAYTLYPNPANDMLHVEGLDGSNEIKIYNVMGVLVKSMTTEGDVLIPVGDLSSGLYLLRIGQHTTTFIKK